MRLRPYVKTFCKYFPDEADDTRKRAQSEGPDKGIIDRLGRLLTLVNNVCGAAGILSGLFTVVCGLRRHCRTSANDSGLQMITELESREYNKGMCSVFAAANKDAYPPCGTTFGVGQKSLRDS
jgi:hypothetical protein